MPSKDYRQSLIEKLIVEEFISTQAEMVKRLKEQGINVTQATISRDIKELQLVRLPAGNKQHRYSSIPLVEKQDVIKELKERFKLFVRDIDKGENILVISTDEGHASGIAYIIDKLENDDIVGTMAGQNTILIVARDKQIAEELLSEFEEILTSTK